MSEVKKIKITKPGVTVGRSEIPVGDVIDLPTADADSLIADGFAKAEKVAAAQTAENDPEGDEKTGEVQTPSGTPGGSTDDGQDDEVVKIRKALDAQYNKDDLIKAAKDAGVEFEYDAKKAEIIEAVIAQNKAAVLLK